MTTAAESRPRKPKKCKTCAEPFQPMSMTHVCCSIKCSVEFARAKREKVERQAQRADTRARKEKIKTRSQWMKDAQQAVNAYVRARDADLPCICCGRFPVSGDEANAWDAGHYRSVGSAPHLRFDAERNIHRQLKQCNRYGSGRAVDYRIGLIARIGLEAVEALEADQSTKKYTVDDLRRIRDEYRLKTKQIKGNRGSTT